MFAKLNLRRLIPLSAILGALVLIAACAAPLAPTAAPAQPTAASQPTTSTEPTTAAQPTTATEPTTAPAATGETVVMWGWPAQVTRSFDENGKDVLVERVKAETGVDLQVSLVEQSDLGAKLKAALPAGTGPDILATDFDVMNPYWGFMEPLNSYAEKEWGADWRNQFTNTSLTEMDLVSQIAKKPGEALYLPGNMQVLGFVMYWKDKLAAADIDPAQIKTYDDFIAACGTLRAKGETALIGGNHPASHVDLYQTLVEVAAPGKMEQAEVGKAKFNDPDMVKTFDLITQIHKECMQEGAIGTDQAIVFPTFHRGDAAMSLVFGGTPWFGFLNVDDQQTRDNMRGAYGAFLFPQSKGLAATGAGVGIVSTSKNKDAAWKVITWLTTGKGAERMAHEAGQPVAFKSIERQPTGTGFDANLGDPIYDALNNGDNKFRRVLCAGVYNSLTKVIPGVVTGQITSQQAADEVQDAFDSGCQQWVQP